VTDLGSLLAANRGFCCSLIRAMDGRIVRCGIISSCQLTATSKIVKRFWATVRSTIASVGLCLYIYFCLYLQLKAVKGSLLAYLLTYLFILL